MSTLLKQTFRFGLVGLTNTGVGLGTILVAQQLFNLDPILSNAMGYAVGLCVSFLLNASWTFSSPVSLTSALRFLLAFAVSYLANLGVLSLALGSGAIHPVLAQVLAMAVYSGIFFLLSRYFVFSGSAEKLAESPE